MLQYPDPNKTYLIHTYISNCQLGDMIYQDKATIVFSFNMTPYKLGYTDSDR